MKNKDFPVINHAINNLRIQKKNPELPILERMCMLATDAHAFAGAYLALWHWKGVKPMGGSPNKFTATGIKLAEDIRQSILDGEGINIHELNIRKDIMEICRIQQQVTLPAYELNGSCSFVQTPPLPKAERDRRIERSKKGLGYFPKTRKIIVK
jgi:hypothetical protein